jgi:hypothetical protein
VCVLICPFPRVLQGCSPGVVRVLWPATPSFSRVFVSTAFGRIDMLEVPLRNVWPVGSPTVARA